MRKTLKHDIARAIPLIVFYDNRKSLIFKVLGVVTYWFIEIYMSIDYLCLQRKLMLSLLHRRFEDDLFDEISGIDIPELLLNIVSCYGYIQDDN